MDVETKAALLTLAKSIQSLASEAAAEDQGQYAGSGDVTTGVRFPMEDELSDLIDRLQADQGAALPPAGGR